MELVVPDPELSIEEGAIAPWAGTRWVARPSWPTLEVGGADVYERLGWMWMGLMMILFWGGLIVLAVLLLRGGGFGGRKDQTASPPTSGPDATEVLRARFARGEISEDEYRRSLTILDETRH